MNGIADTLLQAAVEWRGRPATYEPGGLGSVGDKFNAAFSNSAFADPQRVRSLAFEYFVGLIFNADYEDLSVLVDSWLCRPVGGFTVALHWTSLPFHSALAIPNPILFSLPPDPPVPYKHRWAYRSYGTVTLFTIGIKIPEAPSLLHIIRITSQDEWQWRPTGYEWENPSGLYGTYVFRVDYPWHPGWPSIKAVGPEGASVTFKPGIVAAVNEYGVRETAETRPYPDPIATGLVDNAHILVNWLEGKFGIPVNVKMGVK